MRPPTKGIVMDKTPVVANEEIVEDGTETNRKNLVKTIVIVAAHVAIPVAVGIICNKIASRNAEKS